MRELILKFIESNGTAFHPVSQDRIASEFNLSPDQARTILIQMLTDGVIRVMRSKSRKKGKTIYGVGYFT